MTQYHELTDDERDQYNLPPKSYQGNEMTVVMQGPSMSALEQKIEAFKKFAKAEGMETVNVLMKQPDPNQPMRG